MFEQHVSRLGREMRRKAIVAEQVQRQRARGALARDIQRMIGGFAQVPFTGESVVSSADPTLFDPNTVPGILWWYDSENIVSTTIGPDVFVDSMFDRSTISGPGVKESDLQRPTVTFGNPAFNGAATLRWLNALTTCMRSPSVSVTGYTFVLVAAVTSTPTYLWSSEAPDYCYSSVGFSLYAPNRSGSGPSAYNHPDGDGWPIVGAPVTVSVRFDGTHAGHRMRVNGVDVALTSALGDDPGSDTITGTWTILSYTNATVSSDAEFGTALLWDNAISDDNLDKVEAKFRGYYQHY